MEEKRAALSTKLEPKSKGCADLPREDLAQAQPRRIAEGEGQKRVRVRRRARVNVFRGGWLMAVQAAAH